MATLTALKFDSIGSVEEALDELAQLHRQGEVSVLDVALLHWSTNQRRPSMRHGISDIGLAKMDRCFWGMLFGLTFFIPIIGGSSAALADTLSDVGIGSKFVREARKKIRKGSSALFILSADAISDEAVSAFGKTSRDLISTTLPRSGENRLRELFAQVSPTPSG
jgi:uncharacterized membrane protein